MIVALSIWLLLKVVVDTRELSTLILNKAHGLTEGSQGCAPLLSESCCINWECVPVRLYQIVALIPPTLGELGQVQGAVNPGTLSQGDGQCCLGQMGSAAWGRWAVLGQQQLCPDSSLSPVPGLTLAQVSHRRDAR